MNDLPIPMAGSLRPSPSPLARRKEIHLGEAVVRPSLRTVEGPRGSAKGEPRVIQVLVALADARGEVLSRDDLLQRCWEGRIVGDDAVNRAIGEVRRIIATTGAGFEVETVPRIGFRLTGVQWDDRSTPNAAPNTRFIPTCGLQPRNRLISSRSRSRMESRPGTVDIGDTLLTAQ